MNWKVLSFNIALLHLHMQFSVDVHCFVMLLWACIQFFPGIFLLRTWLLGFKNYKLYIFCRFEQGFQENVSSERVEFDQGTVYPWKTFSQHPMTLERQKKASFICNCCVHSIIWLKSMYAWVVRGHSAWTLSFHGIKFSLKLLLVSSIMHHPSASFSSSSARFNPSQFQLQSNAYNLTCNYGIL